MELQLGDRQAQRLTCRVQSCRFQQSGVRQLAIGLLKALQQIMRGMVSSPSSRCKSRSVTSKASCSSAATITGTATAGTPDGFCIVCIVTPTAKNLHDDHAAMHHEINRSEAIAAADQS